MFGVSRFRDKVAVIAGAEHPLGAALTHRLAAFGATVVAMGRSDDQLMALASPFPARIEPLALRPGRRDVLALLQEAWDDTPLDLYVDLTPLCIEAEPGPSHAFARSAGLASALARGIAGGAARAVIAVPAVQADSAPDDQARAAGYAALVRRFAAETAPARFLGLRLPTQPTWDAAACLSAGDAILMLCHPVSRGLQGGHVIDWAPDPDPPPGG